MQWFVCFFFYFESIYSSMNNIDLLKPVQFCLLCSVNQFFDHFQVNSL